MLKNYPKHSIHPRMLHSAAQEDMYCIPIYLGIYDESLAYILQCGQQDVRSEKRLGQTDTPATPNHNLESIPMRNLMGWTKKTSHHGCNHAVTPYQKEFCTHGYSRYPTYPSGCLNASITSKINSQRVSLFVS